MKSKELNEILNKTRRTPFISLPPDQGVEIVKDLEILEEIRDYFKVIDYGEEYQNRYALQIGYPYPEGTIIPINKELYLKWKRWLNNEN